MVGKTEGAKTRVSRKETLVQEKASPRTYRKSPGRLPATDKSPSRAVKGRSPVRNKEKSPTRVAKSPTRLGKSKDVAETRSREIAETRSREIVETRSREIVETRAKAKSPPRAPSTRTRSPGRVAKGVTPPVVESAIPVPKPRQSLGRRRSITRRSPVRIDAEKVVKKVDSIELDSDSESQSGASEISKKSSYITKLRKSLSREPSMDSVAKQEFDRVVHLKNHYEPVAKLTEFSDEDELLVFESEREEPKKSKREPPKIRYVNLIMTVIDLALSLGFIFGLLAVCNDSECAYKIPKSDSLKRILTYFDKTALLYTFVFHAFIFGLSALPFCGRKCHGPLTKSGKFTYNMNGLFCTAVAFSALGILEYYTENVFDYIFENVHRILVSSFMLAFAFGASVYARAFRVPLSHLHGSALENTFLFNFVYGSQVNPRFGRIDVKTVLFRANYILALIVWSMGMYHSIQWTTKGPFELADALNFIQINRVNYTALTLSAMTVFFLLDALVFEHTWTSTAELQYETFGLMKCLEYCVFFNFFGLIPKHLLDNNIQLESWRLLLASAVFTVGYAFYRASILQKHAFRENPYSPRVAHLESIPSGGKKIICSSYWGFVRHPNYLGDIIMNIAFLILLYANPLSILNFVGILKMFQRAHGDNARCSKRYGPAWERYSQRVPYLLVPKIY